MGRERRNICEKSITTNKNVFASSLEQPILARVEMQKRRAGTKVTKTWTWLMA